MVCMMRRHASRLLENLLAVVAILVGCFLVNYLDRINVSFAALTMSSDLGLSDAAYGFGAGIFFIGYFLFEVPSNISPFTMWDRGFGSRAIVLSWGVVSAATALVREPWHFYLIRFLLGVAEADFSRVSCFTSPGGFHRNCERALSGSSSWLYPWQEYVAAPFRMDS